MSTKDSKRNAVLRFLNSVYLGSCCHYHRDILSPQFFVYMNLINSRNNGRIVSKCNLRSLEGNNSGRLRMFGGPGGMLLLFGMIPMMFVLLILGLLRRGVIAVLVLQRSLVPVCFSSPSPTLAPVPVVGLIVSFFRFGLPPVCALRVYV